MTIATLQKLTDQCFTGLQNYLRDPNQNCSNAHELGCQASEAGLSIAELVSLYQQALTRSLKEAHAPERVEVAIQATGFLEQSLLPFETRYRQAERNLQHRTAFESLLTCISHQFTPMKVDEIDRGVKQALQAIARFFQVECTYSQLTAARTQAICTQELSTPEVSLTWLGADLSIEIVGAVQGSLSLRRERQTPWQDEEIELARKAIVRLAIAIQQAHLYQQTQIELAERQRAEAALRQLNQELELRVQERTAALQNANEQLRQSQVRVQRIAANIPGMIYQYVTHPDGSTEFTYVSPGSQQIFELEPAMVRANPQRLWDMVHPEDVASLRVAMAQGIKTLHPFNYEHRTITPSGRVKWVQIRSHRERQTNGDVTADGVVTDITDRKQTEEALRESEERYRSVIASLTEGIIVLSADAVIIACNASTERILGLSAAQLIGKCSFDPGWRVIREDGSLLPTEENPAILTLRTGQPQVDGIVGLCKPDGTLVWISINTQPLFQAGTCQLCGVVCSFVDITQRRQTEAEIRRNRDLFEAMFEASADAIFLVSPTTNMILNCNHRAVELFEANSRDELIGLHGPMLHKEPFSAEELTIARTILINQGFWSREIEYVSRKGNTFWGNLASRRLQVDGEPMILVRITDISERKRDEAKRKQAEAALQESEEKFRQLAENIKSVFWMVDTADQLLYASPGYEQIWGRPVESLSQQPNSYLEAVHPADLPHVLAAVTSKLATQGYDIEYRVIRPSGEIRWVHDRAFPVHNQHGEIYRFAGIAEDISDLKQAEAQIRASLQEKEILLKEIHHRVKNNLQVVSALLSLQAEAVVHDSTVLAALRDSESRIQAMSLIHETLYQSENLGQLNFSSYIQRLADSILLANHTQTASIHLTYKMEPMLLNLETAIPCGLLLNELVTNAVKHAFVDGNGGDICITLQRASGQPIAADGETASPELDARQTTQYSLSIQDSGIGIPETLDWENLKTFGLRIARDLAQQLRGTLELDRSRGTRFCLTFSELKYCKRL